MRLRTALVVGFLGRERKRDRRYLNLLLLVLLSGLALGSARMLPQQPVSRVAPLQRIPTLVGESMLPGGLLAPAAAITARGNDQVQPALAYNSRTSQYLAVWEDHYAGASNRDIYGQFIALDGSLVGGNFAISWDGSNSRMAPDVVYNAVSDEFLVVWEYESSSTDHDIYARRVGNDGSLIGGEIAIATLVNSESNPVAVYNADDNQYLIVWEHRTGSGEFVHHDIRGQRVGADGTRLGDVIEIDAGSSDQLAPAAGFAPTTGLYLVVWQDHDSSADFDIRGGLLAADGSLEGGKFAISTWEYDQLKPRLAFSTSANEFLVVWEDHHWGWGDDWDIYGQRVNAGGGLAGPNFGISWEGAEHRENPDIAYSAVADEYLVVWEKAYAHDRDDHDVYRRRVGNDGTLLEDEAVVSEEFSYEGRPALAPDHHRAYLVAWEDGRSSETLGTDVYGAATSPPPPTGMVATTATGTVVDDAGDVGWFLSITTDQDGLALISYYDLLNGDLKVARCENAACSGATITALDTEGDVGGFTSIALGADRFAIISYYDFTNGDLKVAHCENPACTEATITSVDTEGNTGWHTAITTGEDGLGLIGYQTWDEEADDGDLKVAHCEDAACTAATVTPLDSESDAGGFTAITIGDDGLGLISYADVRDGHLRMVHCENVACTAATITTLDGTGDVGGDGAITTGADGLGLISYYGLTTGDLKVAHCEDAGCTHATISVVDRAGTAGGFTTITTNEDGLGQIGYLDLLSGDLKLAHCENAACTGAAMTTLDSDGYADWFPSISNGASGLELVGYYDFGNGSLNVGSYQIETVPVCYDFDGDNQVTVAEVQRVAGFWRSAYSGYDLDTDGIMTVLDIMKMVDAWGPCPG